MAELNGRDLSAANYKILISLYNGEHVITLAAVKPKTYFMNSPPTRPLSSFTKYILYLYLPSTALSLP